MALKADKYESNNNMGTATTLSAKKGSLSANIHNSDDEDYFKITLTDRGISTNSLYLSRSTDNMYLYLYRAGQEGYIRGGQKAINLASLTPGTYYINVIGNYGETGSYTLNWNTTAPSIKKDSYEGSKGNNSRKNATSLKSSGTLKANLHTGSDEDYYKITLTDRGTAANSIALTSSNKSQQLSLYDASGKQVNSYCGTMISLKGLAKGVYYAKVYDGGENVGDYSLKWNASAPSIKADKYENNNSKRTARTLSGSKSSIDATIHGSTDVDYYKIKLTASGTIANYIYLTKGGRNTGIVVYDSAGFAMYKGTARYVNLAGYAKGTYTICVKDSSGTASGAYNLSWNTSAGQAPVNTKKDKYENNDSAAKAYNLKASSGTLAATLHSATDRDWYKITLKDQGTDANHVSLATNNGSERLIVYSLDGEMLEAAGGTNRLSLAGYAKGNYYVKVDHSTGMATGDYKLSWNTAAPAVSRDKYEGKKGNDSIKSAYSLKSGGYLEGSIHSSTDQDYYKITFSDKGGNDNYISFLSKNDNQYISLYNSQGKQVWNECGSTTLSVMDGWQGTYYIRVRGDNYNNSAGTGEYSLSWNTATTLAADKYEGKKGNNTLKTATALSGASGVLTANLHSTTDQDWYKITISQNSADQFAFLNTDRGIYISLYNSKGKLLQSNNSGQQVTLTGYAPGTYYLRVRGHDNTYSDDKRGDYSLVWQTTASKSSAANTSAAKSRTVAPASTTSKTVTGPGSSKVILTYKTGSSAPTASYYGSMLKSARSGAIVKGTSKGEMLVAKDKNAIVNPGAGNDAIVVLQKSTVVFDKNDWGSDKIVCAGAGQVDILFNGLGKNDVSVSGGGKSAMVITKKSDKSQKITISSLDGGTQANLVYGGTLSQFNKYLKTSTPSSSLTAAASQEVWKKTGVLAS